MPNRAILVDRAGFEPRGFRVAKTGDGRPRFYIYSCCVNAISEFLEYKEEVKERDHAVNALRYALKLQSYPPLNALRFG